MIECIIDGMKAIPSQNSSIKLVLENPGVRKKNSYTYDIKFPLDIYENLLVFSPLYRQEISVKKREFSVCRLIVGNKEIFSGKGLITAIKDREVSMQIISEVDQTGIPSAAADIWIDQLTYPAVDSKWQQTIRDSEGRITSYMQYPDDCLNNIEGFLGEVGKYAFCLTRNPADEETDDGHRNQLAFMFQVSNVFDPGTMEKALINLAVQPNLFYILEKVLEAMGYEADISQINVSPWNMLYIANSTITLNIAEALPHWTAKTFLEEMQKLFNSSFVFSGNRCSLVKKLETSEDMAVTVALEENPERNYDESGIEYEEYDNLKYELSNYHEPIEELSQEVLKKFPIRKYPDFFEMMDAHRNATEEEKKCNFWACDGKPWLNYHKIDQEVTTGGLIHAGWFNPLFRDMDNEEARELKICPVAVDYPNELEYAFPSIYLNGGSWSDFSVMSYANVHELVKEGKEIREKITIEDVIDEGKEIEEDEADIMEIFFCGIETKSIQKMYYNVQFNVNINTWHSNFYAQGGETYMLYLDDKFISLGLSVSFLQVKCIGDFHNRHNSSNDKLNKHEELIGKFLYDEGIPPTNVIYFIDNKRYIVKQFEIQVNEDGISPEIIGHFYEKS